MIGAPVVGSAAGAGAAVVVAAAVVARGRSRLGAEHQRLVEALAHIPHANRHAGDDRPGGHAELHVVGVVAQHTQRAGHLAGGLAGVAVGNDLLVGGQLGQVLGGEQGLGRDIDRAGDVAERIVFGAAGVQDDRVVAGVAVVQVGEHIGGLYGLEPAGEVRHRGGFHGVTQRRRGGEGAFQLRRIGAGLVVAALLGLEGVGHLLVGAPGRHGVEQVVGIVAHHLQGRGGLAGGLAGVAVQDDLLVLGQLGQAVGREQLLARRC